ncbi:hypothetical protein DW978_18005 [Phocaeicola vulgatus]|nr:hypothetical protein DW978_18005 [Phocaeicola vulgatus]RHK18519.1 hypothetical protein DW077_15360 [Phocaeicola vulgatus]
MSFIVWLSLFYPIPKLKLTYPSISIALELTPKLMEITPKAMELTPQVWEIEVVSKRTLNLKDTTA